MKLDQLRSELGNIDQKLLKLVAERQRLAMEIGRVKRESGLATRNYRQETEVLKRARTAASQLGLSPTVAEELTLLLIRSSLTVQEQDQVIAHGEGNGKRVLVIGGSGKMGQWIARFLASQGFEVEIADPAGPIEGYVHSPHWKNTDLNHQIIVVAAPLAISNEILLDLAKSPPPGLIFDIGSLKSPLRSGLRALVKAGANVTSVHPMFGPDTALLSGRHIILIDLGIPKANEQARELFSSTMATQIDMNLEDHDRLIAYILGLSHALNIAFVTALAESGETAPKLTKLSSTTFDSQLHIASSVVHENPYLYYEVQALNDYGTESLSALLYALERIRSLIRAEDQQGFINLMTRNREYLSKRLPEDQRAP